MCTKNKSYNPLRKEKSLWFWNYSFLFALFYSEKRQHVYCYLLSLSLITNLIGVPSRPNTSRI